MPNEPTTSNSLPKGIGQPATRALATIGITTLDRVTAHTEKELLKLHGMGHKAIRVLKETLAEQGKSLAAE